jgi:hypothetical protein
MQKVFHFDPPSEVYWADACVITCFDARFDLAIKKFLKRRGIVLFDHVKIAGSAKPLADSQASRNAACTAIVNAVRISMRLHRTNLVLIMSHNDCGAYPGVPPIWLLPRLRGRFPAECGAVAQSGSYFVDFDGVYRVE